MTQKMVNITMYGDGSQKTIITGNKNFVDGTRTFQTATFGMLTNNQEELSSLSLFVFYFYFVNHAIWFMTS